MTLSTKATSPLVDAYTRAARRLRQDGVLRGCAHLLRKVARKVARYDCVYFFSKASNEPVASEGICELRGVVVREASRKDLVTFERHQSGDTPQYRKKALEGLSRLKVGHKCVLAEHEGRLIGKAWLGGAESWFISEVESYEKIGPGSIIIFDCATNPAYRGKRVFPLMLSYIITRYAAQRKVIYCEKGNVSSRRAIERHFTLEKKMHLLKLLAVVVRWSSKR